jgi:hypothetical protein
VIIDDNSNKDYLTSKNDLINCEIIESEYPQRGELLAYYYFYKYHFFDKAIIIHDSVFIQKKIDFHEYDLQFLWDFEHTWNNRVDEIYLLYCLTKTYENDHIFYDLLAYYEDKSKWFGCYGLQTVMTYSFLCSLEKDYSFFKLLDYIKTRKYRMALERIFGLICNYQNKELIKKTSIFGNIHNYTLGISNIRSISYDYFYDFYLYDKSVNGLKDVPIIKVWTGR